MATTKRPHKVSRTSRKVTHVPTPPARQTSRTMRASATSPSRINSPLPSLATLYPQQVADSEGTSDAPSSPMSDVPSSITCNLQLIAGFDFQLSRACYVYVSAGNVFSINSPPVVAGVDGPTVPSPIAATGVTAVALPVTYGLTFTSFAHNCLRLESLQRRGTCILRKHRRAARTHTTQVSDSFKRLSVY